MATASTYCGVPSSEYDVGLQKVHAINICHFLDHHLPNHWENGVSYKEEIAFIRAWCKTHNATFYSAEKEDFSQYDGVDKALSEGKAAVICENLS